MADLQRSSTADARVATERIGELQNALTQVGEIRKSQFAIHNTTQKLSCEKFFI